METGMQKEADGLEAIKEEELLRVAGRLETRKKELRASSNFLVWEFDRNVTSIP